jgi:hypothetical protein
MSNTPGSYKSQLADLTVTLCSMVAERLAHWSRNMNPRERQRVLTMIEEQLPTVISNTIAKTASLHSAQGVQYLEEHLEEYADSCAKTFIQQD